MKYINNSHLKSHNLTPTEFKAMYPEVEAIPQEIREANKRNSDKGKAGSKKSSIEKYNKRIEVYSLNPKKCLNCLCIIPYDERKNKFCSHNCATSLTNKFKDYKYTEEGIASLRETGLRNQKNLTHRMKTLHFINKCKNCGKNFNTTGRTKYKKTCSDLCLNELRPKISHRENNTNTKFGYYKGIYCASSWELAFLVYNLDLGKDIKRCDINFVYIMGVETKTYFPDFLMEDKIYEVKGRELEDVALKTQAVIDAGYQIELIRKKEIIPILKFLKKKYSFKCVTELYDKKI